MLYEALKSIFNKANMQFLIVIGIAMSLNAIDWLIPVIDISIGFFEAFMLLAINYGVAIVRSSYIIETIKTAIKWFGE